MPSRECAQCGQELRDMQPGEKLQDVVDEHFRTAHPGEQEGESDGR